MVLFSWLILVRLEILQLHERVETVIFRLAFAVGRAILEGCSIPELLMDRLLDLLVEQQIPVSAVLLRDLEPLEDLGLVVQQVGEVHLPPFDVELVLQDIADHLHFLSLPYGPFVGSSTLEELVTAEQLR